MKLPGFLNKPRWQAKEPQIRRAGVAEDDDAELLASLASIAREDEDAGVRSAALKRLADPGVAQRAAIEDADAGVRGEARKLWLDLIAGVHARAPSPQECERLLRAQDDPALIEHVARVASQASLRGAALARVSRVTLLADRATSDPSPELRQAALDRIEDEAALERIAERTRKTDKRISRLARERADTLRIARGDQGVVDAVARSLCERLERLVREPQTDEAVSDTDRQWIAIELRAGDALRARYRAAHRLLEASRESPKPSPVRDAPIEAVATAVVVVAQPEVVVEAPPPSPEPDAIAHATAQSSIAPAPDTAASHSENEDRLQKEHERRAVQERVDQAVGAFENAVEAGIVVDAHARHAELATLRKHSPSAFTRSVQRRVADAEHRYAELSRWQHWSDNQRRRQLCESIEQLVGSGLHPDAIATRVREAQGEWSQLDAAEGHAPSALHGWARRFHAACRRALEPTRTYFKKRQELRKTHAQEITASLAAVDAIAADSTDWPGIARTRQAVVASLRSLDGVDPHERKSLAKHLKTALTALDARLATHHAEIENAKAALIAEAEALSANEMPRGAASAARALQQRWRDAGNGRRDRDQAQWKTFRAALDAVFGKLDVERSERVARDAGARTRAEALCIELEQLASADAMPPRPALARIESDWDALRVRDEPLSRRFRAAQGQLRNKNEHRERAGRRGPYDAWLARYAICRAAESSNQPVADLRVAWDAAAASEIAADELSARFEAAIKRSETNDPTLEVDADAMRDVLIRIEIFAGLESPRDDGERRRMLQVERLSARMRGAATRTPHQELAALLARWTTLGPAPDALDERLRHDLASAVETLP